MRKAVQLGGTKQQLCPFCISLYGSITAAETHYLFQNTFPPHTRSIWSVIPHRCPSLIVLQLWLLKANANRELLLLQIHRAQSQHARLGSRGRDTERFTHVSSCKDQQSSRQTAWNGFVKNMGKKWGFLLFSSKKRKEGGFCSTRLGKLRAWSQNKALTSLQIII